MSKSSESQKSLGFDLRTRIAAVLPKIFDRIADGDLVEWDDIAEALIHELPEPSTRQTT